MWKSTLKLSTLWEVAVLRDLAIQHLNKLDAVDTILIGIQFHVSQLFIAGCSKLILRNFGPTEKECNILASEGMGFVVQIYGLRERFLTETARYAKMKGSGAYQSHCENIVGQYVRDTFPDQMSDKKIQGG